MCCFPRPSIHHRGYYAVVADILRLKPFQFFILFVFFFLFAASMIQSSFSYSIVYCIGMPYDTGIVVVVATLVVTMAIVTPLAEKLMKEKERRNGEATDSKGLDALIGSRTIGNGSMDDSDTNHNKEMIR